MLQSLTNYLPNSNHHSNLITANYTYSSTWLHEEKVCPLSKGNSTLLVSCSSASSRIMLSSGKAKASCLATLSGSLSSRISVETTLFVSVCGLSRSLLELSSQLSISDSLSETSSR